MKSYRLIKGESNQEIYVSRLPESITNADLKSSCKVGSVIPEMENPEAPIPSPKEMPIALLANNSKYAVGTQDELDPYCHFIIEDRGDGSGNLYPVSRWYTYLQNVMPKKKVENADELAEAMKKRQKENQKAEVVAMKASSLIKKQFDEDDKKGASDDSEDEGDDIFDDEKREKNKEKKLKMKIRNARRGKDSRLDESVPSNSLSIKNFRSRENNWDFNDTYRSDDEEYEDKKVDMNEDDEAENEEIKQIAEKSMRKQINNEEGNGDLSSSSSSSDDNNNFEEDDDDQNNATNLNSKIELAPLGKEMSSLLKDNQRREEEDELDKYSDDNEDITDDENDEMGDEERQGNDTETQAQGANANNANINNNGKRTLERVEAVMLKQKRMTEDKDEEKLKTVILNKFRRTSGRITPKDLFNKINMKITHPLYNKFRNVLLKLVRQVEEEDQNGNVIKFLLLKEEYAS